MFGQNQLNQAIASPAPVSSYVNASNLQQESGIASAVKSLQESLTEAERNSFQILEALGILLPDDTSKQSSPTTVAQLLGDFSYRLQAVNSRLNQVVYHINS